MFVRVSAKVSPIIDETPDDMIDEEEEEMSNALALQPIVLLERMSRDQIHATIEQIKDGYMDNEQSTNDNKIVVRGP